MNIEQLTGDFTALKIGSENEKEPLSRKSSSAGSIIEADRKKILQRNNSEVKMEAIFKELFSPDAVIVDTCNPEIIISLVQPDEIEKDVRNHGKFVVKRETSLTKSPKKEAKPSRQKSPFPTPTRTRTINKNVDDRNPHLRKNPIPLRKK